LGILKECPTTRVRETRADDVGMAQDLFQQIANLGWNGLIVPEKFGGAGLGMLDMRVPKPRIVGDTKIKGVGPQVMKQDVTDPG
jgi:hypothetical protein